MQGAQATWLPDGRRLHLHHGPIDMIVDVKGAGREGALNRAVARFETLLEELVQDLPRLRAEVGPMPERETARIMVRAVAPFGPLFVTPMAAVAGAGAETVLRAICDGPGVGKAYVNNGGDVAFHLEPGQEITAAIVSHPPGKAKLRADDAVRGVATSGRVGRSYSLGIADSVTVLARTAAMADAAATLIANAVDLSGHPGIRRVPANELSPDSDLGTRQVTVEVGSLSATDIDAALMAGLNRANDFAARGLITAASLTLRGKTCLAGHTKMIEQKDLIHA